MLHRADGPSILIRGTDGPHADGFLEEEFHENHQGKSLVVCSAYLSDRRVHRLELAAEHRT